VEAAGHAVDFVKRPECDQAKMLATLGVLHSASLTEFSFDAWEGASEDDLVTFTHNVAGLCSLVAKQHARVPVVTFLDCDGRPVKRLLGDVLESRFRNSYLIRFLNLDRGLPKVFTQCFEEYSRLMRSDLWARLPAFCVVVEDAHYLEQRCATLMAGTELLLRSSLIEGGLTAKEAEGLMFPELIGAARKSLGWDIPPHYMSRERARLLRNAVSHGGPLPQAPAEVVQDFQKWHLFLMRRFFMRLGFDGQVASPHKGCLGESRVSDFSEEHNSFGKKP
jgi:hypothetical protein